MVLNPEYLRFFLFELCAPARITVSLITDTNLIDCHCHILPNLDDGPGSISDSIEMALVLSSFGFTEIYCTPHLMKGAYDNRKEQIEKSVLDLKTALDEKGIAVALHMAAEYYLDEYLLDFFDQPMTMGENVALIEASPQVQPRFLVESMYGVIMKKHLLPLIAHPERYVMFDAVLVPERSKGLIADLRRWIGGKEAQAANVALQADTDDHIGKLKAMGCLFQGNIGSFAGMYGEQVRNRAIRLLQSGLYDRLGTDAHRPQKLAEWLQHGLKVIKQEIGQEGLNKLVSTPVGHLVG